MLSILSQKYCGGCKEWKNTDQFRKNKSNKDGLARWCKSCSHKDDKKYRETRNKIPEWVKAKAEYMKMYMKTWGVGRKSKYKYRPSTEEKRKYFRDWRKNNPEKALAIKRNRRARKLGNGGKITGKEWEDLKIKYDYTCLCCKRREPEIKLTLDHVIPLFLGGSNTIDNSQPLCGICNSRKNKRHIDFR